MQRSKKIKPIIRRKKQLVETDPDIRIRLKAIIITAFHMFKKLENPATFLLMLSK